MEQYTRLDENEIQAISARFDIQTISSFELLSGGSENTNYLVTSENGKYILCICEQKTADQARELAHLLEYLKTNNFNTSKIIYSTNNEAVIMYKGKPIMIRAFLEGKIQKDLSPQLLQLIGKELAKLHLIAPPEYLPKALSYGKEHFADVKRYAAKSEFDMWLKKVLDYIRPYLKLNLPKSFIHSDVFWENVIISEDEKYATIMDFEESAQYYRVFDIGMTIIGTCAEGEIVNLEKVKQLLVGYQSAVRLSADEINALKAFTIYAAAAMAFWRHQNFNYVKPDPKMFHHYLGLKVLADYVFELPDNCFVDLLEAN
ncbi:homoserine kinase [Maribacter sp.]|nr:homoserine kinase [Maribacter sp.]